MISQNRKQVNQEKNPVEFIVHPELMMIILLGMRLSV